MKSNISWPLTPKDTIKSMTIPYGKEGFEKEWLIEKWKF